MHPLDRKLITAAQQGDLAGLQQLLEKGADIQAQGEDALCMAVSHGRASVFEYLLNARDYSETTMAGALRRAAWRNHTEIVGTLRVKGTRLSPLLPKFSASVQVVQGASTAAQHRALRQRPLHGRRLCSA